MDDNAIELDNAKMSSGTSTDYFRCIDIMKGFDINEMLEIIELIAYYGFDPRDMRKKIITAIDIKDVKFIVRVGLTRGANINRILSKMKNEEFKNKLNNIKDKLDIQNKVIDKRKSITIPRILASFPDVVADLLYNHDICTTPVSIETIKKLTNVNVPKTAMHHSVAGLVQPVKNFKIIMFGLLYPYLLVSDIINKGNDKWNNLSANEKLTNTCKFLGKAYRSQIFLFESRKKLSERFGFTKNGSVTSEWSVYGTACKRIIENEYGVTGDLFEDFIIAMI